MAQPRSFTIGMVRCECVRRLDVLETLPSRVPFIVLEGLVELESVVALEVLVPFELLIELVPFELLIESDVLAAGALLWLAPLLPSWTSPPLAWFVFESGEMLPDLGAQVVALARAVALSAGRLPATVAVRLPVVVVSAPTPFAPLVAFRPLKRLSALVDVLLGVVLAPTPAVLPASVGVPFAVGAAVVAPDVLVVAVVP